MDKIIYNMDKKNYLQPELNILKVQAGPLLQGSINPASIEDLDQGEEIPWNY